MLLGGGLHPVGPLATIFFVADVQALQQMKPREQRQQSGQGVDDAILLRPRHCVVYASPALLPLFRWLYLLEDSDVCHKEDRCKGSDPVEDAAKKHRGLRSQDGGRGS